MVKSLAVTEGLSDFTDIRIVKAACPDLPVVSVSGDGGFLFGVQVLATAAQYRLGVTAIVVDNGAYGNVRRDQLKR